ncbi:hypothetical protein [Streptomyces cinereospinus]|uniref:Uncharacterized protein n=1 Tax=Streptomyces cinereospinus TaxID=285561 RepID=A0ABV5N3A2_9ACTN
MARRRWSARSTAHPTGLTGEAPRTRVSRGVADRWEHQGIAYVPFGPAHVVRHLLRPDRVRRWHRTPRRRCTRPWCTPAAAAPPHGPKPRAVRRLRRRGAPGEAA